MATSSFRSAPNGSSEEPFTLFFRISTLTTADDDKIFDTLRRFQPKLEGQISGTLRELLGSSFRVERTKIRRGSVTFWVSIAGVAMGGFTLISQYGDFVRSVELLVEQSEHLLRRVLENVGLENVSITGGWTSGRRSRISPELILLVLVLYLILSHAVLLALFIRLTWHVAK